MKAILVIDMPKSCGQCPCVSFKTDKFECQWRYIDNPDIVQEWCPLKPMPHEMKREAQSLIEYVSSSYQYVKGWNDCLEEILESDEEQTKLF